MKIPKSVKVGKRKIAIEQPKGLVINTSECRGGYDYGDSIIYVSRGSSNPKAWYRFTEKERSETFWHELTHAILHDMEHKLKSNEEFVTDFSIRLNQAIRSAKF